MSDTLSGTTIAQSWIDTWEDGRPPLGQQYIDDAWPESGSASVLCSAFLEYDSGWSALLRVDTISETAERFTVVDMIALVSNEGRVDTAWWNNPRLYHDQDIFWLDDARIWFLDFDQALRRDSARQRLEERYGADGAARIRRERADQQRVQRARARMAGLRLAYMQTTDRLCRHCDAFIRLADDVDWLDDDDNHVCHPDKKLYPVTEHEPK